MAKQIKPTFNVFIFNVEDFGHSDLEDLMRLSASVNRNEKRMFKATIGDGEFIVYVTANTIKEVAKIAQDEFPHPFNEKWIRADFKEVKL